jgi:hypothetical protein
MIRRVIGRGFYGVNQRAGPFKRQVVRPTDPKSRHDLFAEIQFPPLGDRVKRANLVRGRPAWVRRGRRPLNAGRSARAELTQNITNTFQSSRPAMLGLLSSPPPGEKPFTQLYGHLIRTLWVILQIQENL